MLYWYSRPEERPKPEPPKTTRLLPRLRIRKPVRFMSNGKLLPEQMALTGYYARILDVPVTLPSFSTEVIEICTRHALADTRGCSSVTSNDIKAAKCFLHERIIYASCQN
jgi:hypothetical protein